MKIKLMLKIVSIVIPAVLFVLFAIWLNQNYIEMFNAVITLLKLLVIVAVGAASLFGIVAGYMWIWSK